MIQITRPGVRANQNPVSIWPSQDPSSDDDLRELGWIYPNEFAIFIVISQSGKHVLVFVRGIIGWVHNSFVHASETHVTLI
jgi:hypothetical protein